MIPATKTIARFKGRSYEEKDYQLAKEWWVKREGIFVKKEWLSSTGIVVEMDGATVAMAWVYFSNSGMAQIGWATTKPGLSVRESYGSMMVCLHGAVMLARENGATYIHSMSNKSGLTKMFKRLGFEKKDGYDYLALVGGE